MSEDTQRGLKLKKMLFYLENMWLDVFFKDHHIHEASCQGHTTHQHTQLCYFPVQMHVFYSELLYHPYLDYKHQLKRVKRHLLTASNQSNAAF